MKLPILLILVTFTVNAINVQENSPNVNEIQEYCIKESKCNSNLLKQLYLEPKVDDPKLGKFFLCFSKKMGYITETGKYLPELLKKIIMEHIKDETKVADIMKKCDPKDELETSVISSTRCFIIEVNDFYRKINGEQMLKSSGLCKQKIGVSDDQIQALAEGKKSDDPKIKDYSFCVMRLLNLISETGEFNLISINTRLDLTINDEIKVDEIINKCCKQKDSPKESSYQYMICLYKSNK